VKLEQKGEAHQEGDAWTVECKTDRGTYMNIYQHSSPQSARDTAAAKQDWPWGRFRFRASPQLVSQIRTALGA
jgi:hypothetical protein